MENNNLERTIFKRKMFQIEITSKKDSSDFILKSEFFKTRKNALNFFKKINWLSNKFTVYLVIVNAKVVKMENGKEEITETSIPNYRRLFN